jgi:divalent metal cation (Fe/Co/Zn/Cd) transporter
LFALAAYIVAAAGWSLLTRRGASFSWPGLIISVAAIPVMWVLSRRKLRVAEALGSPALRTDAVESITCGWLSFVVVIGLLAQLTLGIIAGEHQLAAVGGREVRVDHRFLNASSASTASSS